MHWKVIAENEVMDVCSAFIRVYLTVGTSQKVMTDVLIRRMFTDPEVIRLYRPCHMFASHACTAQFCNRCAVPLIKFQTKCDLLIATKHGSCLIVFLRHDCSNPFPLGLKYPSKKITMIWIVLRLTCYTENLYSSVRLKLQNKSLWQCMIKCHQIIMLICS